MKFLEEIIEKLNKAISQINKNISEGEKDIAGMQDYYWQNYTEMDEYGYENYDNQRSLFLQENTNQEQRLLRSRYEKMLNSPFFGRVDFTYAQNDLSMSFYIGIGNFSEKRGKAPLIYDWRAPVSSLFYDYDSGPAKYTAPIGDIEGTITAKGQYKIRHGKLIYGFDSDVKIDDEVLARELSSKGSTQLKNIIQTIQREQNIIIRNTEDKILVIQGVAGSGKTSVALHRIAYLLYHDREHLNSKNVLILSPNSIFSDYISHILPELGEENILEMSFDTFAYRELRHFVRDTQDRADLLEDMLSGVSNPHQYKDKQDLDFIGELEAYCIELEDELITTKDITIRKWKKEAKDIENLFYFKFTDFPLLSRMEVVMEYVVDEFETLYSCTLLAEEKDLIRQDFMSMYGSTDLYVLYSKFLKSRGYEELPHAPFEGRNLFYADVYPLLYMKYLLLSHKEHKQIKHLVIDEMQDYNCLQYRILGLLFNCKMTIVGDKNQTLDNSPRDVSAYIKSAFGSKYKSMELNKSYRNTVEIGAYAASVAGQTPPEFFERHGMEVIPMEYDSMDNMLEVLTQEINSYNPDNIETAAIITFTEAEAEEIYHQLKTCICTDNISISLVNRFSSHFTPGITVIPYYLAKGLEFEDVYLIDTAPEKETDPELEMLHSQARYIAATRALHHLKVYKVSK